ncbi:hypothetical protein LCGC14_2482080 [marine sediment metagenome]|uniref:Uncharacterized protein n=1 Tax=marine sediment metagenome TaxID=412755 RepID=A0A0F9E117_9ZZZZ
MSKQFTLPFAPIGYQADPIDFTGDNVLGIYTTETTQRYIYGTRLITWDGRVYKYSNAVAQVYSYWGSVAFEDAAVSWTAVPTAGKITVGERRAVVTLGSRTTDDLAGGYLMTYDTSATTTSYLHGIVGNNDTSTITTIYLDAPMPITTTTSDKHEVFENPYRETKYSSSDVRCAVICVPAQSSAAGYKYWGQTYGPAYISPTNSTIDDPGVEERTVYFSGAAQTGGLVEGAVATGSSEGQHAGFILNGDVAIGGGIAGPLIMLQISI